MRRSLAVAAGLVFALGCSAKRVAQAPHAFGPYTYTVNGAECNLVVTELNCDANSPPRCQWMTATYNKGCEKLVVAPK